MTFQKRARSQKTLPVMAFPAEVFYDLRVLFLKIFEPARVIDPMDS